VRVHPYVSAWLEQVARVGLARRREEQIKELLQEGLELSKAGKKRQAAAKLRQAQRMQRSKTD
jgi:hypothetical protein